MGLHLRSEWADISPAWGTPNKNVPDVFIHHEGGAKRGNPADKPAVLREIEHGVLGKGYIAIDYNLMVFQDGSVWEGRGLAHEDGATINNNKTSVSICAVGNFQIEPAPLALLNGLAEAIDVAKHSTYTVANPRVRIHQEVFPTACPGHNLVTSLGALPPDPTVAPAPVATPSEIQMRFIITDNNPTWFLTDGAHFRGLASGAEAQWLVDTGIVPKLEAKYVPSGYFQNLKPF